MPPYRIPQRTAQLSHPLLRQLLPPRKPLSNPQHLRQLSKSHITTSARPRPRHTPTPPSTSTRIQTPRSCRHNSSNSKPVSPSITPNLGSPSPPLTLSQRMRKLSREYGWAAFGVYMGLSALDFPFCFLAVRALGTERIGQWEHAIVTTVKEAVGKVLPLSKEVEGTVKEGEAQLKETMGMRKKVTEKEGEEEWSWGVEEAQVEASKDNATLWTQLVLAYAIHKSFIFIRVPLTAAVTPKVVKTLRGWGWNIGKRSPKKTLTSPTPPKSS